jgi:hypothetical protein
MPGKTRGYPRPLLMREHWSSLDGQWQFAFDPEARWEEPGDVRWDLKIEVPFSPEAPASGLGNTGFFSQRLVSSRSRNTPTPAGTAFAATLRRD